MTEQAEPKPRCQECMYFETGDINPNDVTDRKYFCKRLPPVPIAFPAAVGPSGQVAVTVSTNFPMTTPLSWCGEWDDGQDDDVAPVEASPPAA